MWVINPWDTPQTEMKLETIHFLDLSLNGTPCSPFSVFLKFTSADVDLSCPCSNHVLSDNQNSTLQGEIQEPPEELCLYYRPDCPPQRVVYYLSIYFHCFL